MDAARHETLMGNLAQARATKNRRAEARAGIVGAEKQKYADRSAQDQHRLVRDRIQSTVHRLLSCVRKFRCMRVL